MPVVAVLAAAGLVARAARARPPGAVGRGRRRSASSRSSRRRSSLSGEATFAGYIKLDDTATWLALTDRVMEHGRSLDGLAPSTYEATLAFNLADGYPVGVFLPLGVGGALLGEDIAWLVQPYMALLRGDARAGALGAPRAARSPRAAAGGRGVPRGAAGAALRLLPLGRGQGDRRGGADRALRPRWRRSRCGRTSGDRAGLPLALASSAALLGVLSAGGRSGSLPLLARAVVVAVAATRGAGGRCRAGAGAGRRGRRAACRCRCSSAGALLPPTSSPLTSDDGDRQPDRAARAGAGRRDLARGRLPPRRRRRRASRRSLIAVVARRRRARALAVAWRAARLGARCSTSAGCWPAAAVILVARLAVGRRQGAGDRLAGAAVRGRPRRRRR